MGVRKEAGSSNYEVRSASIRSDQASGSAICYNAEDFKRVNANSRLADEKQYAAPDEGFHLESLTQK